MSLKVGAFPTQMSLKGRGQGLRKGLSLFMNGTPEARFSGRKKKAHGVSRGKGPQQAEQAREAGDRNLAAFSVARLAGFFSPLLPPTAWSPRRLG